jgi:hypothetical protein
LRRCAPLAKARPGKCSERPMIGIGVIVLFILGIAVLNRLEFGRFD